MNLDSIKDGVVKIRKYTLSSHYGIERFGVAFALSASALIISTGLGISASAQASRMILADTAVYTTESESSITNTKVTIQNTYMNADGTEAFVLIKYLDPTLMSLDANSYNVYVTSVSDTETLTPDPLTKENEVPEGNFVVFGDTGYAGVTLSNDAGIDSRVYDITIRANTQLASGDKVDTSDITDASFAKYDQYKFYVNPVAANSIMLDALDTDDVNALADYLYKNTVARDGEEVLDTKIKSTLDQMVILQSQMDEYETRLSNLGVAVPERNEFIANDVIDITTDEDADPIVDENGQEVQPTTYTYTPGAVVPGGIDIAFDTVTVAEGHTESLLAGTPYGNINEYMNYLASVRESDSYVEPTYDYTLWEMSSGGTVGSYLEATNVGDSTKTSISDTATDLINTYSDYYDAKASIEQEYMIDIVSLEIDAADTISATSVGDAENFYTY